MPGANFQALIASVAAAPTSTWSFISSVTADAATITMPTVLTGDFVLLADMPARGNTGSSQPNPTAITGLTFLALDQFTTSTDTGGATRNAISDWCWGRIVTNGGTESGTVLTGSNTGVSAGFRRKLLLVFRPSGFSPSTFTTQNSSNVWSGGDPPATSTALSGVSAPFLAIATYRGEGALSSPTFSLTADGDVTNGTTTQVSYKIFNATSASTLAADQGSSGNSTITTSFAISFS